MFLKIQENLNMENLGKIAKINIIIIVVKKEVIVIDKIEEELKKHLHLVKKVFLTTVIKKIEKIKKNKIL